MALAGEERRVANFVEFIGGGKGTCALATALSEAEGRAEALRAELDLLKSTASAMFQAPPVEWIARRVQALDETLARDTTRSALVLREALGPIILRPLTPEVGRPYYQAETSLQVLNLLQDPDDGSNSLRKWTRSQPIRTAAEIALSFSLLGARPPFAFQAIASEATRLSRLGMPFSSIARHLGVSDKTVAKAIRRGHFGT